MRIKNRVGKSRVLDDGGLGSREVEAASAAEWARQWERAFGAGRSAGLSAPSRAVEGRDPTTRESAEVTGREALVDAPVLLPYVAGRAQQQRAIALATTRRQREVLIDEAIQGGGVE